MFITKRMYAIHIKYQPYTYTICIRRCIPAEHSVSVPLRCIGFPSTPSMRQNQPVPHFTWPLYRGPCFKHMQYAITKATSLCPLPTLWDMLNHAIRKHTYIPAPYSKANQCNFVRRDVSWKNGRDDSAAECLVPPGERGFMSYVPNRIIKPDTHTYIYIYIYTHTHRVTRGKARPRGKGHPPFKYDIICLSGSIWR